MAYDSPVWAYQLSAICELFRNHKHRSGIGGGRCVYVSFDFCIYCTFETIIVDGKMCDTRHGSPATSSP